jgi:hypothetical protein
MIRFSEKNYPLLKYINNKLKIDIIYVSENVLNKIKILQKNYIDLEYKGNKDFYLYTDDDGSEWESAEIGSYLQGYYNDYERFPLHSMLINRLPIISDFLIHKYDKIDQLPYTNYVYFKDYDDEVNIEQVFIDNDFDKKLKEIKEFQGYFFGKQKFLYGYSTYIMYVNYYVVEKYKYCIEVNLFIDYNNIGDLPETDVNEEKLKNFDNIIKIRHYISPEINYNKKNNNMAFSYQILLLIWLYQNNYEQIKIVSPSKKNKKNKNDEILNWTNTPIKTFTELNYTSIIRDQTFDVKGHWRKQKCGIGRSEEKLIFIESFQKTGYKRFIKSA